MRREWIEIFVTDLFDAPEFQPLQKRVHTFVPQASVVGMLLEHDEAYQVVYSTQKASCSMIRIPGA